MAGRAEIFVQIASYRDPELPRTIASALVEAAEPERLRFGICTQYDDETVDDLRPWANDARFRIDAVPHLESHGCCWARNRVGGLYDGEAYTLQIDAHTRFAPGWDERFIAMLAGIEADRPLITGYPKAYRRRDGRDVLDPDTGIERLALVELRADLTTVQEGVPAPDPTVAGPSPFLAAGLIFTLGRFCEDVPYDPELYFSGEEITMAVRAFSHGYDLRHPTENLLWHHYDHGAPLHWTDHHGTQAQANERGRARIEALLLGDAASLDPYGLGPVRTVAEYEAYAGVDFAARRRAGDECRPERFRRVVRLDTDAVPERDDYRVWVFTLMDADGTELFRRDLTEPDLLDRRTRVLRLDLELAAPATQYLLWPRSEEGWGPRIVRDLPVSEAVVADPDPDPDPDPGADADADADADAEPIYSIVATDTQTYANWQVQILAHTWHAVGQPGELVRLVAAPQGGPLPTHRHARVVATRAPNVHPRTGDHYVPYNRLFSTLEWLQTEQPVGTVLFLDPDMVFRAPVPTRVVPGAPIAQPWYGFHAGGDILDVLVRETGVDPTAMQGVTWPALVHTRDLEALLPRWIELTAIAREEVGAWESDMFAFIAASAEQGLTWTPRTLGAWTNWPDEAVAGAPIIHYCQPIEDRDGAPLWFKQGYRPWTPIDVDPEDARLDYCRDLLVILRDVVATKQR